MDVLWHFMSLFQSTQTAVNARCFQKLISTWATQLVSIEFLFIYWNVYRCKRVWDMRLYFVAMHSGIAFPAENTCDTVWNLKKKSLGAALPCRLCRQLTNRAYDSYENHKRAPVRSLIYICVFQERFIIIFQNINRILCGRYTHTTCQDPTVWGNYMYCSRHQTRGCEGIWTPSESPHTLFTSRKIKKSKVDKWREKQGQN